MSSPLDQPRPQPRIGDAERDRAAARLRDHLTEGRLDYQEFDQRLGRALTARTQPELDALFSDLPEPRQHDALATWQQAATPLPEPVYPRSDPWWTSQWIFWAALATAVMARGEIGWLIPLAAAWVWWLGPRVAQRQAERQRAQQQPLPPPGGEQRPLGR